MSGIKPPADVSPERLFRSLLVLPRPVAPIAYRFDVAPQKALRVQALGSVEVAECLDSDDPQTSLVAASLVGTDGKRIVDVDDLGHLTEVELGKLQAQVFAALARISPSYALSDAAAWGAALETGANAPRNLRTTFVMGACVEAVGERVYAAPEKFFGVPRGALLDGHWMAFKAAAAVYETRRPKG